MPSELRRLLREGLLLAWLEWPELELLLLLLLLLLLRVEFRSLLRRELRSLLLGVEDLGVLEGPLLRGVTDWTCRLDFDLCSIMLLRLLWLSRSRLLRLMLLMLQLRFSGADELIPPFSLAAFMADMEMLFLIPGLCSSLLLLLWLWLLVGRDDRLLRLGFSSESKDVVLMAFFRVLRRIRRCSPLRRGLLLVLADSDCATETASDRATDGASDRATEACAETTDAASIVVNNSLGDEDSRTRNIQFVCSAYCHVC